MSATWASEPMKAFLLLSFALVTRGGFIIDGHTFDTRFAADCDYLCGLTKNGGGKCDPTGYAAWFSSSKSFSEEDCCVEASSNCPYPKCPPNTIQGDMASLVRTFPMDTCINAPTISMDETMGSWGPPWYHAAAWRAPPFGYTFSCQIKPGPNVSGEEILRACPCTACPPGEITACPPGAAVSESSCPCIPAPGSKSPEDKAPC